MTPTARKSAKPPRFGRRLLATLFGLTLVGGLTTACSSDDSGNGTDNDGSNGAYPVTVSSTYGDITLDSQPERVLATNPAEAQFLVALGIDPIAIGGEINENTAQWAEKALSLEKLDSSVYNTSNGFNIEAAAKYNPDLIVGSSYNFTDGKYEKSSAVAPSFGGAYEGMVEFDDKLDSISLLTHGSTEEAEKVRKETEDYFTPAKEKMEELQGKTYQFLGYNDNWGLHYGNGSILERFGLIPDANQDNSDQTRVSNENVSRLSSDVLVISYSTEDQRKKIESNTGFRNLPAYKNNRIAWVGKSANPVTYAINAATPQSLEYLSVEFPKLLGY